jgi:hypothetical protein
MKAMSVVLAAALTLMLLGCAQEQKQSPTAGSPGQSQIPRGTVLVKQLPAGAEGVELSGGSLRLKSGYTFVKQPRQGFAVARMGGQPVTSGGCGCTGGTCDPELKGGIIVCENKGGCTGHCGLALTVSGVKTQIIQY